MRDKRVRGGIKTEIPPLEKIPVVTEKKRRETERILAKLEKLKENPLKGVEMGCPMCGGRMRYSEDLVFEVHAEGRQIVIPNLSGVRCEKCGDESFDMSSSTIIDRYTRDEAVGGHETSITVVGAGKLGMYFPKDVLRTMDLRPKSKAIIKPLTRRKMVVELQPRSGTT